MAYKEIKLDSNGAKALEKALNAGVNKKRPPSSKVNKSAKANRQKGKK